jgi:hypothetical protein
MCSGSSTLLPTTTPLTFWPEEGHPKRGSTDSEPHDLGALPSGSSAARPCVTSHGHGGGAPRLTRYPQETPLRCSWLDVSIQSTAATGRAAWITFRYAADTPRSRSVTRACTRFRVWKRCGLWEPFDTARSACFNRDIRGISTHDIHPAQARAGEAACLVDQVAFRARKRTRRGGNPDPGQGKPTSEVDG